MDRKFMNTLASRIAKAEGNKSQVKIGDIREIIKILVEEDQGILLSITIMKYDHLKKLAKKVTKKILKRK